jgi:phosphoribosylformylglycinamidine synthase
VTFSVVVEVSLRTGISDPEGATIERALPALGFGGVSRLQTGKVFRFDVEAANEHDAITTAQSIADRLLSNPVIEESTVRIEVTA